MHEPSVRTSRLAIAGGLVAALVVGGAGFVVGRNTAPRPAPIAPVTVMLPTPEPSPSPDAADELARGDLVALADRAADAFASGSDMPAQVTQAAGRRFELLLPFGCAGPSAEGSTAPMRWSYDAEAQTLRVSAAAVTWQPADWRIETTNEEDAVAEGFWIARPWASGDRCPARPGQAMPTGIDPITLPGQTLAIAQFFSGEVDRDARRGDRPYQTVQRVSGGAFDGSQGLRLRVTGRIDRVPGGAPVRCIQPAGIEQRPICVIAATFEQVRIENPVDDTVLGTWSIGRNAR